MPGAKVFIQVNTTGEIQKSGCPVHEVPALVEQIRSAELELEAPGFGGVDPPDAEDLGSAGFVRVDVGLPARAVDHDRVGLLDNLPFLAGGG